MAWEMCLLHLYAYELDLLLNNKTKMYRIHFYRSVVFINTFQTLIFSLNKYIYMYGMLSSNSGASKSNNGQHIFNNNNNNKISINCYNFFCFVVKNVDVNVFYLTIGLYWHFSSCRCETFHYSSVQLSFVFMIS